MIAKNYTTYNLYNRIINTMYCLVKGNTDFY